MARVNKTIEFSWNRVIVALAWSTLLLAFLIGQLASQTDYDALLQKEMPDLELIRYDFAKSYPMVYATEPVAGKMPVEVVMGEGNGFGGPLMLGIRAERSAKGVRSQEIVVLSHRESPAYLKRLQKRNFFRQFINKDVTDNFILGDDIDAVSGATVSSEGFAEAIRQALHTGAVEHLGMEPTWSEPEWHLSHNEYILVALFALAFFGVYRRDKVAKLARLLVTVGTLVFVGFYANVSISLGSLAGIVMGYVPAFTQQPLWWIMMVGALGSILFLGRNIYCHQICPFSVIQDLLQKISGIRLRIKPTMKRKARAVIFFLSWIALILIFLSTHPALGSYEPFSMMFSLEGMGIQWYILPASLLGSFFIPGFWCRLFCPVGLYLNEMVRIRRNIRNKLFSKTKAEPVRMVFRAVTSAEQAERAKKQD